MIEVEYAIFLPDGASLSETELPPTEDAIRALIPDFAGAGGALIIRSPGAPDTVFADTLRILIHTFCLSGLADLLRDGQQFIDFFDHEETARITIAGPTITFAGDQIETVSLPLADYIVAQRACGDRYVTLARRLWHAEPNRADSLAELESGLAQAAAAAG